MDEDWKFARLEIIVRYDGEVVDGPEDWDWSEMVDCEHGRVHAVRKVQ